MRVGAGPSILVAATMAASLIAASAVAVAPEGGSVAAASPSRPPSGDAVAASGIAPILTPATLLAAGLAVLGMVLLIRHRWWRLELAPPPARRFPATWSVGWAIALLASSVVLGSILLPVITAVLGAPPDLQTLGGQLAVAVPVHLVQGGLILLWWRGGRPDGDRLESGSWGGGGAGAPRRPPGPAAPPGGGRRGGGGGGAGGRLALASSPGRRGGPGSPGPPRSGPPACWWPGRSW